MSVEVGDEAPDIAAACTNGEHVRLSDFRGRKHVLLVFYPLAFSRVCSAEFCVLREENLDFVSDDVEVLGCSTDSVAALKAWKKAESYPNEFVADFWPHGDIARAYDVFREDAGVAKRGTFLIDKDGIVRWLERSEDWGPRDQGSWRQALAGLGVPV